MSAIKDNAKASSFFMYWIIFFIIVIGGGTFAYYKFVAPEVEQARTDVYENSQAYVRGMQRDLRALQTQYMQAEHAGDEATKSVLKATIREKASSFDLSKLSSDLRSFVEPILNNR